MENSTIITGIISPAIALIPTLILVWRNWEKQQISLAVRIIRKKAQIQKAELDNQTRMEKLKLELKTLEEEANYQQKMSKWESGEFQTEQNNQLTNKISDLKTKGEQVIQKGVGEVKKTVEDLKSKGTGLVKGLTDQFKNLKDKKEDLLKSS